MDQLIESRDFHGLRVKQDGHHGKGVYAELDFRKGDVVLKDQILAGVQHSENKIDCLVCSFCFRFIGSIELQIGRKLYLQELGVSPHDECHGKTFLNTSEGNYHSDSSGSEDDSYAEDHPKRLKPCSSTSSKSENPLLKETVGLLMSGDFKLPYSEKFQLPSTISCPGGCKEAYYCSQSCAEADWDLFHALLCTGPSSKSYNKDALLEFIRHANETNDIFLLAAKVVCYTILKYRKIKAAERQNKRKRIMDSCDLPLLLEAWKPFSLGYKRRWWECIALPDDVDCCDEAAFRMQIKELAFESLQLLKTTIFDSECEPLFSLEIYGHIIGMFELNNLDLVVASPVEDYFLYIDDLPQSKKKEVERITKPFLDVLGEDYSVCCQGTAFFPLQSCMNHSCNPNAKAFKRDEDRDGQATIIAVRPIIKGEEVTISYIDEELSFQERQALLADYGFKCSCTKCLEEEP